MLVLWLIRLYVMCCCCAAAGAASDEVTPEERSVLHTVGAAGLVAFVDVYDSLESAAK